MDGQLDIETLGRVEKVGALVVWPTRPRLTLDELRLLGEPLRDVATDVLRELAAGRD